MCSEQQAGNRAYRPTGKDRKAEGASSTYSGSKRLDMQPWNLHLVPQIHVILNNYIKLWDGWTRGFCDCILRKRAEI